MCTDWERFEHDGATYARRAEEDTCHGAPWEEEDGHGPVSGWERREKSPGEMILVEDHGARRFYDFAEAVRIARRDGWDAEPFGGTTGERANRAALADFDNLRRWCAGDWHYVGVIVAPVCECCNSVAEAASVSLWGVESSAGDYLDEVSRELADEIAAEDIAA